MASHSHVLVDHVMAPYFSRRFGSFEPSTFAMVADDNDIVHDDDDVDVFTTHWFLHIVIYIIYVYCCIMLSVRLRFLGPWP